MLLLFLGQAAWAAVTCTHVGSIVTVSLSADDDVGLRVSGGAVQYTPNFAGYVNCETATTANTDTINVTGTGDHSLLIDLSGGPFAPGVTDEPGASDEIEFSVDLGGTSDFDFLGIEGSSGADAVVMGTGGINLNAAETDGVDADVTVPNIEAAELVGGDGGDILSAAGGSGTGGSITLPEFLDLLGEAGNDTVTAGGGSEFLDGGPGTDMLDGGPGSFDLLLGGPDNDSLNGGPGLSDLAVFFDATGPVTASLAAGTATGSGSDTLSGIEDLTGTGFNDSLTGDGGPNQLRAFEGNDTLAGGDGVDGVHGGPGNDVVDGGPGNDDDGFACGAFSGGAGVRGGSGNDQLTGGSGNDRLCGVEGTDSLDGGIGDDVLDGGSDTDSATYASSPSGVNVSLAITGPQPTGGGGTDTLIAVENLTGSGSADMLAGNVATNRIEGGGGSDTLNLAPAPAQVIVNLAAGVSLGGTGTDAIAGMENVVGSAFDDSIIGDALVNLLAGGTGNDSAAGAGGNDRLRGEVGNDRLKGQGGNDRLAGGPGKDRCSGGPGKKDKAACEKETGVP